jgi:histidine kinase-like protein
MRPQQMPGPQHTRAAPPPGTLVGVPVGSSEVTLVAGTGAPAAARAAVSAWMAGRVSGAALAGGLLVGELVADSVRHAEAPADADIRLRAQIRPDALRPEVRDHGTGGSIARRAPNLERGGGFGLNVVRRHSRCRGVHRDAGAHVLAEFAA